MTEEERGARDVFAMVRADLDERERIGYATYGGPLRTFNGRNALRDAYEEALDQAMYLRQAIDEREWHMKLFRLCAKALPPNGRARDLLREFLGDDPGEWK